MKVPEKAPPQPVLALSSSSSHEAVILEYSSPPPYDYKAHQYILKRVVATTDIQVEEIHKLSHRLIDIIAIIEPSQIHLHIMTFS